MKKGRVNLMWEERRLLRRDMIAAACVGIVLLLAATADAWVEWPLLALEAAL